MDEMTLFLAGALEDAVKTQMDENTNANAVRLAKLYFGSDSKLFVALATGFIMGMGEGIQIQNRLENSVS